ncbi:MAG: undecaprenyl/decaprenyl-phosphate alpha-N-acetylglucosaminyl 1-phosphate transferase [Acidobacteriota bacterium]|nr:undecaprenyl/decaprenyl-phosphate alpha-N-acetylglucosaminyl 1-phosphate transferase [Acidobacteriota bacterium]
MSSLLWLGFVAFAISLILTPIFRDVFRSYGVVDQPDTMRKLHKYPIPRVGGMAIASAYVACFFLVPFITHSPFNEQLSLVWNLLPAVGVIFAVGIIDDLFGLKPWQKLIGQLAGAGLAYWSGVRVLDVAGISTQSWWSLPVTLLWLLTCTNAFNLVDGMDGLAAGVGMFATLTMFIAAMLHGNMPLALATLPLAGCLLGFLCYNFNPATIFLGDSGSLLIGFLLGCYGVIWSQKSATLLGMTAPLMAVSIPLIDVALAVARRLIRRQPIFSADRGHIHHRLLDRGLTPKRAVLVLYAVCGLVAAFSLLQSFSRDNQLSGVIILLFLAVAWVGIQHLGYAEFSVAGRMLFRGNFQGNLKAQLDLHTLQKQLESASSVDDCWRAVSEACGKFGFRCVLLEANGLSFDGLHAGGSTDKFWTLRVPLGSTGHIEFSRELQSASLSAIVGPFVEVIHTSLLARLRYLRERPPIRSDEHLDASSALGSKNLVESEMGS